MKINIYRWAETDTATKEKILRRSESNIADVADIVRPIIEDVRLNGDDALVKYAEKFDGAKIDPARIKATDEDFAKAEAALAEEVKDAIRFCADNVRKHHEDQMKRVEKIWLDEVQPGVFAGEQVNPIPSTGLYVPRGKGAFPSVMYMLCTPAVVAGVKEIHVVTPPTPDGGIDDASLYAAQICGVKNVYKAGGAQAIAALAFGTQTISRVCKVAGPGNAYVSAAKRLLAERLDPGMPAGPSEALIVADETANPKNTALDLLNEAEHGPDSASILVTHSEELANQVIALIPDLIKDLTPQRQEFIATGFSTYGGIVLTGSMQETIDFCNEYAVEHLHLKVANPEDIIPQLVNTGEILIGEYTPIVLGNFGIGVNAVLPTGQKAKTQSCTSVWDFLKRTSIALADKSGYDLLKDKVITLADYEGFPAHANVLRLRDTENVTIQPPVPHKIAAE